MLPGVHRSVEWEGQALMMALLEDRILAAADLLVAFFGEQGFESPRGVFAQFGSTIHFISGSFVLPDPVNRPILQSDAAGNTLARGQGGIVECSNAAVNLECGIEGLPGGFEGGNKIVGIGVNVDGPVFDEYRSADFLNVENLGLIPRSLLRKRYRKFLS